MAHERGDGARDATTLGARVDVRLRAEGYDPTLVDNAEALKLAFQRATLDVRAARVQQRAYDSGALNTMIATMLTPEYASLATRIPLLANMRDAGFESRRHSHRLLRADVRRLEPAALDSSCA